MSKKYISVILTLLLAGVGCAGGGDNQSPGADQAGAGSGRGQVDPAARGKGQLQGRGQSRGQGLRGVGRGRVGAQQAEQSLQSLEPVSLTRDEHEAIDIQTIHASYRPLKAELSAMGKVVAPPRTMAIVSYAFPARVSEVHVRLGDWVEKGQKVVTLESE